MNPISLDPRLSPLLGSHTAARARPSSSFADHLATGLDAASAVARVAGTVIPGAGLVSVALSGLSRLIGGPGHGGTSLGDAASLVSQDHSFNLQFLRLQEQMQRESRVYTALSNIMRVRHEAAKNAIDNIR